jgi:hypothetical protein
MEVGESSNASIYGEHVVISEHEGPDGTYYRLSGVMERSFCEQRAKRMVEEEGAISAMIAKAESRFERRYNCVEVKTGALAYGSTFGGQLAGKAVNSTESI